MGKIIYRKHVITLKYAKVKLIDQVKIYATKVLKAKGNKLLNMKEWMKQSNKLFDLLKKVSDPLLFDEDEMKFYNDQKSVARKMALSKEVDIIMNKKLNNSERLNKKSKKKIKWKEMLLLTVMMK